MECKKTTWSVLSAIDCSEHIEKKKGSNGKDLSYLSWAWAWGILKKHYPDASFEIKKWDGKPYLFDENLGYMVETSLTVDGETLPMWLPVMDGANKAQKHIDYQYVVKNPNFKFAKFDASTQKYVDKYGNVQTEYLEKKVLAATMFDINTALMRCLTKNMSLFGLGHYIYAGEDLPQVDSAEIAEMMEAMLEEAKQKIKSCKTRDEMVKVYNSYPQLKGNEDFNSYCTEKGRELRDENDRGER